MNGQGAAPGAAPFTWAVRVYYEDTDAGGVVYYANYLKFMERARTEWLRSLGFEQDELRRDQAVIFAVRSAQVDYLAPARFNDLLSVSVEVHKLGKASITLRQAIRRDREVTLLCDAIIKVASLDADTLRPQGMPGRVYDRLRALTD
jgi:acyl-CoA thioester hydrolase